MVRPTDRHRFPAVFDASGSVIDNTSLTTHCRDRTRTSCPGSATLSTAFPMSLPLDSSSWGYFSGHQHFQPLEVESSARKLRLNSERLEEWVAEWERTGRPAESGGTEFVELPPLPYYEWPGSFICKVSDQRERTHGSRATARIRLAARPPCGGRPENAGSRSKNPPDANFPSR